jgi:hypothetical protein
MRDKLPPLLFANGLLGVQGGAVAFAASFPTSCRSPTAAARANTPAAGFAIQ